MLKLWLGLLEVSAPCRSTIFFFSPAARKQLLYVAIHTCFACCLLGGNEKSQELLALNPARRHGGYRRNSRLISSVGTHTENQGENPQPQAGKECG